MIVKWLYVANSVNGYCTGKLIYCIKLIVAVMALFSKLGNILKQTSTRQISNELQPSKLSIFQAIRCMSSMASSKLFIGGISYQTDEQSLREAFAKYGEIVDARIIVDRDTGRSRGFGFVTYTSSEEASSGSAGGGYGAGNDVGYTGGNYTNTSESGSAGFGGSSNFDSGAFEGNAAAGFGGNDQFGSNESPGVGDDNKDEPLEGNYRDDDDDSDFAKRA
ncbi:hypothetical protein FEM48_Zijuj05G0123400 [Ziziphus jujuba var. spinosa]|uniref:RRM domain-containing protein n=1 Tax=Ziziphus jujuba var. spinosa TaxID=714518 RepID=A0A978VES8_ZIZJJ|nr:hypothetical protein FEM48_Zijuj05G0123400 [Ziziphus jujuba var. spinosa]